MGENYPREWELDALLRDGTPAHVRPIRPEDEDGLVAFHSRLSAQTIYRRFFSPRPVLPPKDVHRFTNVDYRHRMALVALIGGEMAGVARYDGKAASDEAEVAFVIEDRHQGRGLGSLLLEHLAAAARERGITSFFADTMADNRAMLGVFRDAGFVAKRSFADGLVHLEFPIASTPEAVEAMGERERRASVQSMAPLLRPRSIAVVGASRRPGSIGHEILRNLLLHEFTGPVFPVNPEATSIAGVAAFATIGDVPGEVDLAIVTVPAPEVHPVVDACGRKGVRAVLVVSSGFAETGSDVDVTSEQELVRMARGHGMRLVGPNAMGVLSTMPEVSMDATFLSVFPQPGRVALLAQSGALGTAVLQQAVRQGIGFSSFVSVGNRADVSGNDLLQYWEADGDTDVILLYLETFGNPRKFARIAQRVARSKPIVVVKSGRHLGNDVTFDALFRQAGVIRVDTVAELFDVGLVLAHQPIPRGPRLAILGNASGPGVLAADAVSSAGVVLALVEGGNPVDLPADAGSEEYGARVAALLAEDAVDAVLVIGTPFIADAADDITFAVAAASATRADKPVIAAYLGGLPAPGVVAGTEGELHPIPIFPFPEQAVRAFGRAAAYASWRNAPEGRIVAPSGIDLTAARVLAVRVCDSTPQGRWLDEGETASLLAAVGLVVDDVATIDDGITAVVGLFDDKTFGPLLSFGLAGVGADLLDDRAARIVPLTDVDAAELVRAVRLAPLLFGHGGRSPIDEAALLDVLARVSALAEGVPELAELELSPVVTSPRGIAIGGARVRLASPPAGPGPLLRRLR
ncbi:MAG TPA: GNAT family N-acetyltransferase [Acidimicrobiales bacterium]|nr:GNAT family N-acetyltransferase [Acidimicrobiales bacterium]